MTPCLSVAIDRLKTTEAHNFAIWVTQSPFPGGNVHADSPWPNRLTHLWQVWQAMFSPLASFALPTSELIPSELIPEPTAPTLDSPRADPTQKVSDRLMQDLGHGLWQWVFEDSLRQTLAQSQGIASGQNKPLRFRLEIHDPNLIALPWEIMQPEMGQQAIALDPHILFSRTTSQVATLNPQRSRASIHILLVVGAYDHPSADPTGGILTQANTQAVDFEQEAATLTQIIEQCNRNAIEGKSLFPSAQVQVTTLVQPNLTELIAALDSQIYNVFFYSGHGIPEANGGLLFLHPQGDGINGTELAQVLVRNQITLSVFNACWGAQPQQVNQLALKHSSLAEVLIRHGVPAVVGMRDAIANEEATGFIQGFTQALTRRLPIDRAIQIARQQLLTTYRFNHPAWTIPILYMHPEFDGELISPLPNTVLPEYPLQSASRYPRAYLRSPETPGAIWQIYGGLMRVGRNTENNDLINPEPWVSQRHADIICREIPSQPSSTVKFAYYLKDCSRFGTWILNQNEWQKVHQEERPLTSEVQIKFGSLDGQIYEFVVDAFLESAKNGIENKV